jgi:hypothetical protein
MGRFSFGELGILDDLRSSGDGSKGTFIVDDIWIEVELRVNILSPGGLELGVEDTVDDADVLCGLAEVLATPAKIAIYVPDVGIERDGRRSIGLLVCFQALRRENAVVDDDFATGGGDCHCAGVIVGINTWGACYPDRSCLPLVLKRGDRRYGMTGTFLGFITKT